VAFKLTNPGLQGGLGFNLVNVSNGNVLSLSGSPTSSTQVISGFSVAATSQSLDFGALSAGKTLAADILVRSNVAYSLSLSSSDKGSFANPSDATSAVANSLSSNGGAVSLNPGPVASGAPATYGSPVRYAISVTILPILNFPSAGSHADTVTVTLTSP
jgi:hypothetical protein